jgi:nucleoside-diphosphate-sugar epimerase
MMLVCVQEFMVEVEVRAAQNVLEACAQTDAMERVVFTSSVTAVIWKDDHKFVDAFDERNWSDLNFCRNKKVIPLEGRKYSVEEEAVLL